MTHPRAAVVPIENVRVPRARCSDDCPHEEPSDCIAALIEERERFKRRATRDSRTCTARRSVLDEFAEPLIAVRRQFAIALIDLDSFKKCNDELGHQAGDRVLLATGLALRGAVREAYHDLVVRYGGDEFLVFLVDGCRAHDTVERLRTTVNNTINELAYQDGVAYGVTCSVGVALHPDERDDLETMIALADSRMRADKKARGGAR